MASMYHSQAFHWQEVWELITLVPSGRMTLCCCFPPRSPYCKWPLHQCTYTTALWNISECSMQLQTASGRSRCIFIQVDGLPGAIDVSRSENSPVLWRRSGWTSTKCSAICPFLPYWGITSNCADWLSVWSAWSPLVFQWWEVTLTI